MDRLSAEDQLMLWPDKVWPQDIGALALLDGTPLLEPDGRFRIETVREVVAGRLHLVPRFRQVLYGPPHGLGRPLWVDDPSFDLTRHVRLAEVDVPGDEAALLACVERLRRRRLDMARPLWEMWFLTGLPERRVGLFVRLHHVVADGIAGVATLTAFFDAGPDAPVTAARPWLPEGVPARRALVLDRLRRAASDLFRALSSLLQPFLAARRLRAAAPALRELLAEERVAPTSLNRVIGPDRSLALLRSRLDDVRAVGAAHGATINDVLLALTAGGLRSLLRGRDELRDGMVLRVYVPVTLRKTGERARAQGNLISQMVVPLPVGMADPAARLRWIARETARRKAHPRPSLAAVFRGRLGTLLMLKVVRRNPVNVSTADVPGPEQPLWLAGAPILEVFPLLNLIGNVPLSVGALSYAGRFDLLVVADRDAVPDLDAFTAGAREELVGLTAAVPGGFWAEQTEASVRSGVGLSHDDAAPATAGRRGRPAVDGTTERETWA